MVLAEKQERKEAYFMPNTNVISITDMTQKAYDRLLQEDYATKTYQQYWYCGVVPIRRYCEQQGIEFYSIEHIADCVNWFQEQYKRGDVYSTKFNAVRKIAAMMKCISEGKPYQWQILTPWYIAGLPDPYHILLENYVEQKRKNGYKETSIRAAKPIVKHFLMYAASLGYESIRNIALADIIGYIPKLAESYQRVGDALSVLKSFGNYLYEGGFTELNLGSAFSIKAPSRKKLHVGFTQKEATAIISNIDRSTICGKRDYAILMLAMHTGLRGVDVLKLTFASIDWEKREIHLTQSKTSQELTLPVPMNVLNAIADYILHARPKSREKSIIFLRVKKPYLPMKTWSACCIVRRNAARAGIEWSADEWKGFHSFRRTIANWMLEAEVPLETITEILGQRNTDSTRPYISVHQSGLAECALDLQSILMRREELR